MQFVGQRFSQFFSQVWAGDLGRTLPGRFRKAHFGGHSRFEHTGLAIWRFRLNRELLQPGHCLVQVLGHFIDARTQQIGRFGCV